MPAVEVSVLGAVELRRDGRPLDLGAPKQRALVAGLALARGWPVSVDSLVDLLWADDAPPGVTGTLQAYVSQLRRVIEPDRPPRAPATVLVTASAGYALKVPEEAYDAHLFERAVLAAHRRLQALVPGRPVPLAGDVLEQEVTALDAALARWRGTPYAELGDADDAVAERSRLQELRLVGVEDRASALLALGDHGTQAAELEALTLTHPLRERLWALRAVALARSGRQADALDVLRRVREVLDEELGIEPSAELRDLQTALLRQDARLDWSPPERTPAGAALPAVAPGPPAVEASRPPQEQQVAPWPMVGRDAELASLVAGVMEAESGRPAFAVVTGEPGIGKSRLAAEALLQARHRGARVLVGRCSQDEGAPPLWPWSAVLEGLGADLMRMLATGRDDEGGQFRAWEAIGGAVRCAAREETVVVLLEDLHWADPGTLRVLRLLMESTTSERLMVVATWRAHPAPTGLLADVAETFARRHARWSALEGLHEHAVRTVFEAVAHQPTARADAGLLLARTDGNPFFLVELARLAAERGGAVDLAAGRLPSAVGEVIDRRLARLPEETVEALRVAAVIGRRFDLTTLAEAARLDEDDALDVVEPAQAIGLLRDHGIDHYLFAHALVRDRLREGLSATRRARLHARVATALEAAPGRESEAAEHWRLAGPGHAARAWTSAVAAAGLAARLHDHDRAAALLRSALDSQRDDPASTASERFGVLMRLVESLRWAGRLADLVAAVEEAVAVAREVDEPEAVARAAMSPTVDVLWRSAPPGELNPVVVGALEESLERLPPGDGELRCRTLLALAIEQRGVADRAEVERLVEDGLAMARRLDDAGLVMSACQVSFMAVWAPDNAQQRLERISEAVSLARDLGHERTFVVAATLRASVLSELGLVAEMWTQLEEARAESERLRIPYGEFVLTGLEVAWLAVAGRFDGCRRGIERIERLRDRLEHSTLEPSVGAARAMAAWWAGAPQEAVPVLDTFVDLGGRFEATLRVALWRAGREVEVRERIARQQLPLEAGHEASVVSWCHAAELAAYVDDPAVAEGAYDLMLPFAGRPACVANALVFAPVDAYLALAAHVLGRPAEAGRHLDQALALADRWGMAAVTSWLEELRTTFGF